ncbi:MAG: hypothetical protein IH623_22260 [Verrucomicrobia bacterium]|nr:hypothetical protein [Verrucomicrobiota bacterium]
MQTQDPPAVDSGNRRKWFYLAAVAIALVAGLWFGVRYYGQFKEQRRMVQARNFLEAGKYREAHLTAQLILRSNPQNVEACRIMAELTERVRDPSTIAWRRQVAQFSPTLENQLTLAAAAMLFERPPYPLARQTLEEIQAAGQESAAYHVIAAQVAIKLNQTAEAQAHYEQAIKLEPEKESHRLNLAVLRLQSNDPAIVAGARATLEQFREHPRLGAFALRSLIGESLDKKDRERARKFSEQLLAQPQAVFADRVQHLSILQAAGDPAFNGFLATLRHEASTNELAVYQLANWMTGRGMAEEALGWIEGLPADLQTRQPVPKAVVEGLLARKDWSKLESVLNGQQWEGQEFVRLALMSLALRHQDLRDSAQIKLQEAVRLAARRVENLAILSQMLESWSWQTEAEETLELIVSRFPQDHRATAAVCMGYYEKGNTPGLYRVFGQMLKAQPNDLDTANNFAMVCLLLSTNLTQAHALAELVGSRAPDNSSFVSTRAYSLHLQGKPTEAVALLRTLPESELETPGIALYYGLTLAATGEVNQARKFLALAEKAQLLPEEKRLREEAVKLWK